MGVKVNESGTIKNLALDRDEVETLRAKITIPVITISAYRHYLKAADLGITNCYATTKYSTDSSGKKSPPLPEEIWADIPDSYKVVVNQGMFNFRITAPCKFKKFTGSTYYSIDNILDFPSRNGTKGFNARPGNPGITGGNSGNSSWNYTAYICFVFIIDNDGEHWRVEAALVRNSSAISESTALNDNYAYQLANSSSYTFPYTIYFYELDQSADYVIEKMPYTEATYVGNSIIV